MIITPWSKNKPKKMTEFKIDFLDHVAIRVKDIKKSAEWYQKVLGLKIYQLKEWGDFPILLLSGKTGVALFPENEEHSALNKTSKNVRIDHFAFNLTNDNFERAKIKYKQLGIKYHFEDHHYFHSIYTEDLDGHTVELTTIALNEKEFYQKNNQ